MEKDEEKGGRVWLPGNIKSRLDDLKVHPRQPYYEVIEFLIKEYEKKKE
jgi:hypothetical protein